MGLDAVQKRAYVILDMELAKFRPEYCWQFISYALSVISGKTSMFDERAIQNVSFLGEIQKILHLTDISIDDIQEVLEKLYEKWKGERWQ